jgi:hypothetical protein
MWKYIVEPGRPQMTIGCTHIACWITEVTHTHTHTYTHTHTQNVILVAFPLQQWLNKHSTMLRYMYITCLVLNYIRTYKYIHTYAYIHTHTHTHTFHGFIIVS